MPVLKVYKDGVWEEVAGVSGHSHSVSDIVDFPNDLASATDVADLQNTIDAINEAIAQKASIAHTHEEYASATDVADLQTKVGDTSVSEQISNALANFSSGKTLTEHLAEEDMILSSHQYGDTLPTVATKGKLFFKKV